jgi:hypothetical protein
MRKNQISVCVYVHISTYMFVMARLFDENDKFLSFVNEEDGFICLCFSKANVLNIRTTLDIG